MNTKTNKIFESYSDYIKSENVNEFLAKDTIPVFKGTSAFSNPKEYIEPNKAFKVIKDLLTAGNHLVLTADIINQDLPEDQVEVAFNVKEFSEDGSSLKVISTGLKKEYIIDDPKSIDEIFITDEPLWEASKIETATQRNKSSQFLKDGIPVFKGADTYSTPKEYVEPNKAFAVIKRLISNGSKVAICGDIPSQGDVQEVDFSVVGFDEDENLKIQGNQSKRMFIVNDPSLIDEIYIVTDVVKENEGVIKDGISTTDIKPGLNDSLMFNFLVTTISKELETKGLAKTADNIRSIIETNYSAMQLNDVAISAIEKNILNESQDSSEDELSKTCESYISFCGQSMPIELKTICSQLINSGKKSEELINLFGWKKA